jgi:hypothetical protein
LAKLARADANSSGVAVAFAAGVVVVDGAPGFSALLQLPMTKIAKITNASMESFMESSPGFYKFLFRG